jgi:hypothetical protein
MITLRVRFSGLCLFHEDGTGIVVRVLDAPGHTPQLWLDTGTGTDTNKLPRKPDSTSEECVLVEDTHGTVGADWRNVAKYTLDNEEISFGNGGGSGPSSLPGVAQLTKVHPDLGKVNPTMGVGALITLNHGSFNLGPMWPLKLWNDRHPKAVSEPVELPLWTDLLIETTDTAFKVDSSSLTGGWELKPLKQQVDIWIFADGATRSSKHFTHLYDVCHKATHHPWPEFKDTLPPCQERGRQMSWKVGGSTFCPDGEYP